MNRLKLAAVAFGLAGLAACNNTPQEKAADNIEANAENAADNLEEVADNTSGAAADSLNNKADEVRQQGEAKADATRTSADLDGNSAAELNSASPVANTVNKM